MFRGDRWAEAFVTVCAGHAEEGLGFLREFASPLALLPGRVAGSRDALAVEAMLRAALKAAGIETGEGAEYAVRFVALLIRRGRFSQLGAAVDAVERRVNAAKGVLVADLESAHPLEGDLRKEIEAALIRKYGAAEVRLVPRVVPELLGGYRLRIGSDLVDSTLKGQLQRMAWDLNGAEGV